MLNLNKTAIAVLVALSGTVSAGTMGPEICTPGSVSVPCEQRGWNIFVGALYLEPIFDANYAYANTFTNGNRVDYQEFDHKRRWAFNLEGSWEFGQGNAIIANWYHFDNNRGQHNIGPFASTFAELTYPSVENSRKIRWDEVDLTLQQQARYNPNVTMYFDGGVEWASIRTDDHFFFPTISTGGTAPVIVPAWNNFRDSHFDGFGPLASYRINYSWCNGFGVYAKGATSLLVGRQKFRNDIDFVALPRFAYGSKNSLVPELQGTVAAMYNHPCDSGVWSIEGGYTWINYFNALHNQDPINQNPLTYGNQTNLGLHGAFVRIGYVTT